MDNANGLVFVFLSNESADIECAKTGGVETGCRCGEGWRRRRKRRSKSKGERSFFVCLRMNVVADLFVCLLVTAAHVFVVSGNGVRWQCCAAFVDF